MKQRRRMGTKLHRLGLLGINERNASYTLRRNPRRLFPLVDDKLQTKRLCEEAGIPTARLLATPGVVDGAFVQPEAGGRLAAVVVLEDTDADTVLQALSGHVEQSFMPRPLRVVQTIPRNETGKLLRRDLTALLHPGDDHELA